MASSEETLQQRLVRVARKKEIEPEVHSAAKRTAFVARFIVLREGRRSRAHREIEALCWEEDTTAEQLYDLFRKAFVDNGDKLQPVDRDLRRALEHAQYSADYFSSQYSERSTLSFLDALIDYVRSNRLLFGEEPEKEEAPRTGGWRLPDDS